MLLDGTEKGTTSASTTWGPPASDTAPTSATPPSDPDSELAGVPAVSATPAAQPAAAQPAAASPVPAAAQPASSAPPAASTRWKDNTFKVRGGTDENGRYWDTVGTIAAAWLEANPDSGMTKAAVMRWIVETNNLKMDDGRDCRGEDYKYAVVKKDQILTLPEGKPLGDFPVIYAKDCGPKPKAVAAAEPVEEIVVTATPEKKAITVKDPQYAFPDQASPDDFNLIRAGFVAGVMPMDPPDVAARSRVTKKNSAGTWAGEKGEFGGAVEGTPAALGLLLPPPFNIVGTVAIAGAHQIAVNSDDTRYQRGAARQPWAMILRGWGTDEQGNFYRLDPSLNKDQPEYTINSDGLNSLRLTLSTTDPNRNIDSMTRARVSQALTAPNFMSGIMVIKGLSQQAEQEMAAYRANPNKENLQRVIDLTAAAAKTDFAVASGLNEQYAALQEQLVKEAAQAGITGLKTYDMRDALSLPNLNEYPSGPIHPLRARSYEEIKNDPGFPGNDISEAEYNERFAGRNFDYVYARATSGTNKFERFTAQGFGTALRTREQVNEYTEVGVALINRSPATREAFRQAVARDPKFGRIIGEAVGDWIIHPETYGFGKGKEGRANAIAAANAIFGEEVVKSEFLSSKTDVPERKNEGRARRDQILADAFVANASDGAIQFFLTQSVLFPQDKHTPENVPGTAGRAILQQLATRDAADGNSYGAAFASIAAAAGLTAEGTEKWFAVVNAIAGYVTDVHRGSVGRYSTKDEVAVTTIADEATSKGVTRVVVDEQGKPVPVSATVAAAQAGKTLTSTGVTSVVKVQEAEVSEGSPRATIVAVQTMMADPYQRNVALESMAMFDRPTALTLLVKSMADNPEAYEKVRKQLKKSDKDGLFKVTAEEKLANRLERAAERWRALDARRAKGETVSNAEYETAMKPVIDYMAQIDAAAQQAAAAEAGSSSGRDYRRALRRQDSIVKLVQFVALDPEANAAMGVTANAAAAAMDSTNAGRAVNAVQAAGAERTGGQIGNTVRVRATVGSEAPNSAAEVQAGIDNGTANAGSSSISEARKVQAKPGLPVADIIAIVASIAITVIPGGGKTPTPENPPPPSPPPPVDTPLVQKPPIPKCFAGPCGIPTSPAPTPIIQGTLPVKPPISGKG